jgi:3-methylcrotonyl-CoA carboxylase alpha subunit
LSIILREQREAAQSGPAHSPWTIHDGWRLNAAYKRRLVFRQGERELAAIAEYRQNRYEISIGKANYFAIGELGENGQISAMIDGQRVHATAVRDRGRIHVFLDGKSYVLVYVDPLEIAAQGHSKESSLLAPMPGRVIAQMVQEGERVEKGAPLLVLEAMKMECTIHAPAAGRVEAFHYTVGDQVTEGVELLHFETEDSPQNES